MGFEALAALGDVPLYFLYRVQPKANGKTDKIPVSPRTGYDIDHTDATHWVSLSQALEAAPRFPGTGVAMGITQQYKNFCIDIDNCLDDATGDWSEFAKSLIALFPGALVEVSHSGRGLHIFGMYSGELPPHGTKRKGVPFELYSRLRFMALTGIHMAGTILLDWVTQLGDLIARYLPASAEDPADADWTTAPAAGYGGPAEDEALIDLMMKSRPRPSQLWGGRATIQQLWNADGRMLSLAYPPNDTSQREWDESSADQAIANHLAYFTGKNCERMRELMFKSKLVREKWQRDSYIRGTILKACRGGTDIYRNLQAHEAETLPPAPSEDEEMLTATVPVAPPGLHGTYLFVDQQTRLFERCVYVEDVNMVLVPDGALLNQSQFNARFSGYKFPTEHDGSKPTTKAWDAFVLSLLRPFPKVRGTYFAPLRSTETVLEEDGYRFVNSWRPITIRRRNGNIQPFLTQLKKCHPTELDQATLLAYFAFLVQHIGRKAQWAPLLQGLEGNGKTFFSRAMEYCLGKRYTHWPKAAEIDSRFNEAFYGKLLICVEDVKITEGKESMWESLKPMITNDRIEIEGKGIAKITREVCYNFILNSNYQDGVRKTANDRRIAPFFGAQQFVEDLERDGMTAKYFIDLYDWANHKHGYAAIAHYLQHYKIPDELNPAIGAIRAPLTSSTKDAIYMGAGMVETELQEAIAAGQYGFCGGFISSNALETLLHKIGKGLQLSQQKRSHILKMMGYIIPEALLPWGLLSADIPGEGKIKLYVRKDNPVAYHPHEATIRKAYLAAQAAVAPKFGT